MNQQKPLVVLIMMVKNEEHCIERAIKSALPYIDYWVIIDTGSTDGTKAKIRSALTTVPGELLTGDWVDFGSNRTILVREAEESVVQYELRSEDDVGGAVFLTLDADDQILSFPDVLNLDPAVDCWTSTVHAGAQRYEQIHLLRAGLPWYWEGKTHEALMLEGRSANLAKLDGFEYLLGDDSSRRKSGSKTTDDIDLLEQTLEENPDDPRAMFYLANSYRDNQEYGKAVDCYAARTQMAGFDEERFMSALRCGECMRILGDTEGATLSLLAAIQMRPWRAEPFVVLSTMYREIGSHGLAHMWARNILSLPTTHTDRLFCDPTARGWRGLEEYLYGTAFVGDWAEHNRAANEFYATAPPGEPERVLMNCNRITAR